MSSVKHLRNALFLLVVTNALAFAQSPPVTAAQESPNTATTADSDQPEISTQEQAPSFQVKVNLVEVRVVVREAHGNAVGNLKQDDFILLDDKKPQAIARFSVERNEPTPEPTGPSTAARAETAGAQSNNDIRSPLAKSWRLAYLVDDVNSTANDLTNARKAVEQAIDSLVSGELLGIFTLSGQGQQDFTNDKARLHAAVAQLQPRPQGASVVSDCPPIDYYIADQFINYGDVGAFKMVVQQIIACQFDGNTPADPEQNERDRLLLQAQERAAHIAIDRVYRAGEAQADFIFQSINQILRHVSQFGGQRTMVLLSPGFYLGQTRQTDLTNSLNRAIAGGVVISTLDLRGVVAQRPAGADISRKAFGSSVYGTNMIHYEAASSLAQSDPLLQIANATGGRTFRNSNDFSGGLASLSAPPEFSYLLGFKPQNLANDGKFHPLKVELKQPSGYTVQARNGYYAPFPGGSVEQVKREVAEAVFSHDEIHELPMRVQTQFFKAGDDSANVIVLVHVDVRHMQFKKADGRNLNELTVVAAVFDRNANLVTAKTNTVKMHIKDATLENKLSSGITVKNNFDVKPGSYLVRVVARDEQGKMLTQNEVVDIP